MFSSSTFLAVVDQLQCGPIAVSLHYQVQQVLMLDWLLAEEEDAGSIPSLSKCAFCPRVQGGHGKAANLLILNCLGSVHSDSAKVDLICAAWDYKWA